MIVTSCTPGSGTNVAANSSNVRGPEGLLGGMGPGQAVQTGRGAPESGNRAMWERAGWCPAEAVGTAASVERQEGEENRIHFICSRRKRTTLLHNNMLSARKLRKKAIDGKSSPKGRHDCNDFDDWAMFRPKWAEWPDEFRRFAKVTNRNPTLAALFDPLSRITLQWRGIGDLPAGHPLEPRRGRSTPASGTPFSRDLLAATFPAAMALLEK